ncbi:TPM domain-containing protein [Bifidobacterium aquikefiri]|uniref:TPM domain-containing protein n=1 Tax=Bifidobacterium aquikefiri TaxID=1653207 RepID=UPI0023F2AD4E|nr:TPM domain-containing protein [Bifidobacterium aquikefiri]
MGIMDITDNGHGNVVECAAHKDAARRRGSDVAVRICVAVMASVLALVAAISLVMLSSNPALAATSSASPSASDSSSTNASSSSSSSATISDAITDTQNLLGGDLSSVTDAITRTKKETGVTVRLLYLANFDDSKNPNTWTSQLLESLDPQPNTVMLAVASQDGNLVVAVSSNSDEWLKKQSTVDDLSKAALNPIVSQSTPDWAASAKDMMNAIVQEKKTSTTTSTVWVGVAIFAAVLLLLAIVTLVVTIMRRRHAGKESGGHRHSHRGERKNTGMSLRKSSRSRHARHGRNSAESESRQDGTNNTESSQGTSSL